MMKIKFVDDNDSADHDGVAAAHGDGAGRSSPPDPCISATTLTDRATQQTAARAEAEAVAAQEDACFCCLAIGPAN